VTDCETCTVPTDNADGVCSFCRDYQPPTAVDLFNGKLSELDICNPCWFYAGRLTDPDTGASWRYIYRSTAAKTCSRMFQPVLAWLADASPIGDAQITADPNMMFGTGELTLWEA
jgi:hypothetical protein